MNEEIKLTRFSSSSGCGCKIHPAELEEIICDLKTGSEYPNLLVGNDRSDDASVMKMDNGDLLIQTADFFTPIVDDPFLYGKIAAANALSDVYAMGGKPLMANALLGWPSDKLSPAIANMVLKGAVSICEQAGIPLAGGHSIKIQEPVFGLSVTGMCKPDQLKTNSGAKVDDVIYITKPLGIGILASALKKEKLDDAGLNALLKYATHLNKEGHLFGELPYIHAMTDITGFGLLGHLMEMCHGAGLGAELISEQIPLIEESIALASQFVMPDNTYRNWNAYEKEVNNCPPTLFVAVNDPQTNGGLMVAVDSKNGKDFEQFCQQNLISIFRIGKFKADTGVDFK